MSGSELASVALAFGWAGLLVGLAFIETPLKFRAPGVTLPIGLGIGRLVFDTLAAIEAVLVVVLTLTLLAVEPPGGVWAALVGLWTVVLVQRFVLRPRMRRRTDAIVAGQELPRSRQHLWFVGLDLVKLALLLAVGIAVGLDA